MDIARYSVTSVMGPSGCGKSTFIRCLNRMHDMTPGFRMSGEILLDGTNIHSEKIDPVYLRRRVGMVFQQPNPFPRMSVFENVAVGLKLNGGSSPGRTSPRRWSGRSSWRPSGTR